MESESLDINQEQQVFKPYKPEIFDADILSQKIVPNSRKWSSGEGWVKAENLGVDIVDGDGVLFVTEYHSYETSLKDGVLEGSFNLVSVIGEETVLKLDGEITCVVFEDDCKTARVIGIVNNSTAPQFEGKYAIWIAVDNGDGTYLTTDMQYNVSQERAEQHCLIGLGIDSFYGKEFILPIGKIKVKSMECFGNAVEK